MTQENKTKTINVRFSDEEWNLIENAKRFYGVKTRGNLLRFLLIPKIKNLQQEVPISA